VGHIRDGVVRKENTKWGISATVLLEKKTPSGDIRDGVVRKENTKWGISDREVISISLVRCLECVT
jgi:hypothetical protein